MTRVAFILRLLYAAAFVFATVENFAALAQGFATLGWRIPSVSRMSEIYFQSLLVINPAVAVLLLLRARVGLIIAGIVTGTNVAHNACIYPSIGVPLDSVFWMTVGFFVFYLATIIPAWRGSHAARDEEPNKAPEPTPMSVTSRAPSSTSRASHRRGSS